MLKSFLLPKQRHHGSFEDRYFQKFDFDTVNCVFSIQTYERYVKHFKNQTELCKLF